MTDGTREFLKRRFRDYYTECDLYLPNRFGKREFGFMFFDADFVQRHMNFATKDEIKQYLVDRVPAHVYHSGAYYTHPGAPNMALKEWLGSDLIFDLDADDIPGAEKMNYEQRLDVVKRETVKLIDNFLVDDFGFEEKDMLIPFSGGRGYHVHVRDPRVWTLTSHERREIVDHVQGMQIDEDAIFRRRPYASTPYGLKYRIEMPLASDGGWRGRIARGIIEEVERLKNMERTSALARLRTFEGIGDSTAKGIYGMLFEGHDRKKGCDHLKQGNLDIFPPQYLNRFKKGFLSMVISSETADVDEVVTADVKRLIRLPTSLHGKTGFRVAVLSRSELDDFDPLLDAIPSTWTDDDVVVRGKVNREVQLKGETFDLKKEATSCLPEYAGIFCMCRGMATLEDRRGCNG